MSWPAGRQTVGGKSFSVESNSNALSRQIDSPPFVKADRAGCRSLAIRANESVLVYLLH